MIKFKLNLKLLIMMIKPLIVALQQYNHQVRCCIKSENVIVKQKQKIRKRKYRAFLLVMISRMAIALSAFEIVIFLPNSYSRLCFSGFSIIDFL